MNDSSISAVINTYNEELNIRDCIESVKHIVDEIVVVDMHSSDRTAEIARSLGARVLFFSHAEYVEPARNFALQQARGGWILLLDADERFVESYPGELGAVLRRSADIDGYRIPRRNNLLGRWLTGTRLGPDEEQHIRLFRRGAARWSDRIHSAPAIEPKHHG